jgi:hypothetical protein
MSNQNIQSKQDKTAQVGAAFNETGTAFNDNAPSGSSSGKQLLGGLSWAWIVLSGVATCVWLAGVGWMAVQLFRWLVD